MLYLKELFKYFIHKNFHADYENGLNFILVVIMVRFHVVLILVVVVVRFYTILVIVVIGVNFYV